MAIRRHFCLLSSLGAEDLANWELNGGKNQAEKFVHKMDFLFFWRFAVSRYRVSFSLKAPPSTNQLVTGRERRGKISHVVTARDAGFSLSQACCPWSLDNHSDTSTPGDCFHYNQNFRGRVWLSESHSIPLINKHPQGEIGEKGEWPSLWDTKPRKGNKKK